MTRKQYSARFKAKVAMEAMRGGEADEGTGQPVWAASYADRAMEEAGAGGIAEIFAL